MAPQKRQSDTGLEDQLYDSFYEFSFFRAVDLLEQFARDKKKIGDTLEPGKEVVRFSVKPGFSFPPSDISGLGQDPENGPSRMEVAFMGLIGPSGLLPNWYNELALERRKNKDHAFIDFLNIFHHRLISLFYLAWKKQRFPENYAPGAGDRLSRYILSLAGLGTSGMVGLLGLPRESLTFYAGLLSLPVASAAGIEAAIEYFSGAPTRVDQFVERDVPLEPQDCTKLGSANASLGIDAVCGTRVRECQTKFRVNLGPIDYTAYTRFIPMGDLLLPVFSLIRYMVGIEFEFEIRVFLKKEEVPSCVLGEKGPGRVFLGWTTWAASPGHEFTENPYITFEENDLKRMKVGRLKTEGV
ncbi:type VI secretion system baseplate subunit TssG [Desulfospira joergensenii]|uniref:type VI secretion system baseplate subunit TssG n=1 Tax=Desulfospira joergensenii TaxID=53329 RepID=UPI0003B70C82|nr:type VI secretion system baseplate subunit TssG [Desulfospira joergensenii]